MPRRLGKATDRKTHGCPLKHLPHQRLRRETTIKEECTFPGVLGASHLSLPHLSARPCWCTMAKRWHRVLLRAVCTPLNYPFLPIVRGEEPFHAARCPSVRLQCCHPACSNNSSESTSFLLCGMTAREHEYIIHTDVMKSDAFKLSVGEGRASSHVMYNI